MAVSKLTKEQIEILSNYPQVARTTDTTVVFTQTFKRHFCEEYIKGKSSRTILQESGIDPNILGATRMHSLMWHALKEWEVADGKIDQVINKREFSKAQTVEDKFSLMEHELIYARQEIEYLKKILLADCKARRNWELEHQQPRSLQLSVR
jgi:hypothetical protein